jgi:hypothetical protein
MTNLEAETEERQADVAEAREDDERHNVRIVAEPQSPQRSQPLQQKTQSRTLLPLIDLLQNPLKLQTSLRKDAPAVL